MAAQTTAEKKAERLARQAQALELHLAGVSPARIGQRLHCSETTARRAIADALAEREADADAPQEVRTELARVDAMLTGLWSNARRGDVRSVDAVLKLGEYRRRLVQPGENTHELRNAYDASVTSSTHLVRPLDEALVAAGRRIAERVDEALATGEGQEVTKALYLVPHMVNILREMLATPAARQAAGLAAQGAGTGRLAQLRAIHGQKQA